MRTYLLKRLLLIPLNLFGITVIAFTVMHLAPGDPAAVIVGSGVSGQMGGKTPTREALEKWRHEHHLDEPLHEQYRLWIVDLCHGNFGESLYFKNTPVWDKIVERAPITIKLNVVVFILIYLFAIPIGIYSAWRPYTVADHAMTVSLFVLYSLPSFWIATLMLWQLCCDPGPSLYWLALGFVPCLFLAFYAAQAAPTTEWKVGTFLSIGVGFPALLAGFVVLLCWAGQLGVDAERAVHLRFPIGAKESHDAGYAALHMAVQPVHTVWHYFLAIVCMTYGGFAFLSRQMRAGMMECVRQDYIRTARAKGLPETRVILKHALRNSLIPIITLLGTLLPALLGGSVIIEQIFGIQGLGLLVYEAITNRDYPLVIGEVFIASVLTLIGLLISDLLYVMINPTISFEKAAA